MENSMSFDLGAVISDGRILRVEIEGKERATVYLNGRESGPMVIGVNSEDKTDFQVMEKAYMMFAGRIDIGDDDWEPVTIIR